MYPQELRPVIIWCKATKDKCTPRCLKVTAILIRNDDIFLKYRKIVEQNSFVVSFIIHYFVATKKTALNLNVLTSDPGK